MVRVAYYVSPMESSIGKLNARRKKPLKRAAVLKEVAKKCKKKSLVDLVVKTGDINTFCVTNKRGKNVLPVSPLLSKSEKERVWKGLSWLLPFTFEPYETDTEELSSESDCSSDNSTVSSDSSDGEFIFN